MIRSNVIRYAVLAVSANKNSTMFQQDYQVGLAVLGLYELEERKLIFWDEASTCHFSSGAQEEPPYLCPLCEAIKQSSGKTLDAILFTVLTRYMKVYTDQVEGYLKDNRLVSEKVNKSLFGLESKDMKAEQEAVEECKAQVLALCSDHAITPAQWVLAEVLLKTGLLDDSYNQQEAKSIKEKLQERQDIPELRACEKTLGAVDRACSIGMAVLATTMFS